VASAEYVHVQMEDGLAAVGICVDHRAIARLRDVLLPRDVAADNAPSCAEFVTRSSDATCSRVTITTCTGACGLMSRNATQCSSSNTIVAGISRRTIRQKMQSSAI
jgi:hypothetical protein